MIGWIMDCNEKMDMRNLEWKDYMNWPILRIGPTSTYKG